VNRFQPKNLRERVAKRLANAEGWESADQVRRYLPLADEVITMVLASTTDSGEGA
jgi:hypothetical protein